MLRNPIMPVALLVAIAFSCACGTGGDADPDAKQDMRALFGARKGGKLFVVRPGADGVSLETVGQALPVPMQTETIWQILTSTDLTRMLAFVNRDGQRDNTMFASVDGGAWREIKWRYVASTPDLDAVRVERGGEHVWLDFASGKQLGKHASTPFAPYMWFTPNGQRYIELNQGSAPWHFRVQSIDGKDNKLGDLDGQTWTVKVLLDDRVYMHEAGQPKGQWFDLTGKKLNDSKVCENVGDKGFIFCDGAIRRAVGSQEALLAIKFAPKTVFAAALGVALTQGASDVSVCTAAGCKALEIPRPSDWAKVGINKTAVLKANIDADGYGVALVEMSSREGYDTGARFYGTVLDLFIFDKSGKIARRRITAEVPPESNYRLVGRSLGWVEDGKLRIFDIAGERTLTAADIQLHAMHYPSI